MASKHRPGKPSFEEAIRAYAEASRHERNVDIAVDEILAYIEGKLPSNQVDEFRERLVLNHEAAKLVADLVSFPDLEPTSEVQSWAPEDGRRQRETLERRLVQESLKPSSIQRRKQNLWLPKALAAAFFLTSVGLGLWVQSLYQTVSDLSLPSENVKLLTLRSASSQRDWENIEAQSLELRKDSPSVVLMLQSPDMASGDRFQAKIFTDEGALVWHHKELRPDTLDNLTLRWPRRFVQETGYRIEIYSGSGTDDAVATYRVKVHIEGSL